eukprot:CAMPEP_0118939532 /NCGR_PEP_ID=MMETSP1169-20130426/29172_1 /TAXON_ID=36882 /ORGANISM="Pyramimonas obovata, Strain CCMP722" /LENGTH=260 /DNA_ID=CAMNT_0006883827 /DNA_START=398 /DNA_END=1177 /DNA_ORIENTATION=+
MGEKVGTEVANTSKRKQRKSYPDGVDHLECMSLGSDPVGFEELAEQLEGVSLKRSRTEEVIDDLGSLRLSSTTPQSLWLCPTYPEARTSQTALSVSDYQLPITGRYVGGEFVLRSSATMSMNHASSTHQVIANVVQQMELSQRASQLDLNSMDAASGPSTSQGAIVPWVPPVKPEQMVARAVGNHLRSCLRRIPEKNAGMAESTRMVKERRLKALAEMDSSKVRGKKTLENFLSEDNRFTEEVLPTKWDRMCDDVMQQVW